MTALHVTEVRLLADVGYGALTMDAVAAEAGVGKATIYRRWRTKEDLVVDTIADLDQELASPPDTGSLEGDLRAMTDQMRTVITGPSGAATLSLLSSMPHNSALATAFREGPMMVWRQAFAQIWDRAEARGEVGPGMSGSILAETTTALMSQRWLLTGLPVDKAFTDDMLDTVVLPLFRLHRPTAG
jgi:AcrR family transcriptional regulator